MLEAVNGETPVVTTIKKQKGAVKGRPQTGKKTNNMVVSNLSQQNMAYLRSYKEDTRHSYSSLVNFAIDNVRKTDAFAEIDVHEPRNVIAARELLEKWAGAKVVGKSVRGARARKS